jgi:hypothetical protein
MMEATLTASIVTNRSSDDITITRKSYIEFLSNDGRTLFNITFKDGHLEVSGYDKGLIVKPVASNLVHIEQGKR